MTLTGLHHFGVQKNDHYEIYSYGTNKLCCTADTCKEAWEDIHELDAKFDIDLIST